MTDDSGSGHDHAVIFDVDGTLVDSNDAHAAAWQEALAEFGIARDRAAVRRLIGMGGDKLLPTLAGISSESELGKRIAERRGGGFANTTFRRCVRFPTCARCSSASPPRDFGSASPALPRKTN